MDLKAKIKAKIAGLSPKAGELVQFCVGCPWTSTSEKIEGRCPECSTSVHYHRGEAAPKKAAVKKVAKKAE